jgi:hypothetical protein
MRQIGSISSSVTERMERGDVRYRFVADLAALEG